MAATLRRAGSARIRGRQTTVGAEGLDVTDREHLLIADDPDDFAAATVRVLTDENLRAQLAARGRRLAEERYDWTALGMLLSRILRRAVAGRGERS